MPRREDRGWGMVPVGGGEGAPAGGHGWGMVLDGEIVVGYGPCREEGSRKSRRKTLVGTRCPTGERVPPWKRSRSRVWCPSASESASMEKTFVALQCPTGKSWLKYGARR
jgi:hypothetical protein